jgi:hypothetical protein
MANLKQNRIEIRGLSDSEINYLKALVEKNKAKSFNEFLLSVLREKIEYGQFNRAQDLYLAYLVFRSSKKNLLVKIKIGVWG